MSKPSGFPEIAIVGMGLIGGSLGLALSRRGLRIRGTDSNRSSLMKSRRAGAAARVTSSIRDAVKGAGIVVICVPVDKVGKCLRAVSRHASRAAVITDVASVKAPVMAAAERELIRPERFVGGHPLAGSERSGFEAATADLFRGRLCVLTPGRRTLPAALRRIERMWRLAGARTKRLTAERHDSAVARTSHLPHVIAGVMAQGVLRKRGLSELASGSFLDATRVALSSPDLWREILVANRREVESAVREFIKNLRDFGLSVESGKRGRIGRILRRARKMRARLRSGRAG